jgi:hypothetical protein
MAYGSPEFIKYKAALQRMAAEVYPQAIADTLNQVAGFAHYATAKNIRSRFTLRNRYTEGSLRFYKASPKAKIEKINAVTGSFSEYMVAQDAGGERRPKRGSRAPVVTLAARGGNPAKVVRKKYHAGQLGPGQFVGQPSGQPLGVWERYQRGKTKHVRLIRSLAMATVPIKARRWHRDGVEAYAKQSVIEAEFVRQAKAALAAIKK